MNPKVMDAVGFIGRFVADHWESMIDQEDIFDELLNQGFSSRDISDAFKWIERNTLGTNELNLEEGDHLPKAAMVKPPCRVLTAIEQSKITSQAFGVLVGFYDRGLIDPVLLEDILERAMRSDSEEIGEKEMRRIAALTLFNKVQAEWREFLHTTNTLVH